MVSPLQESGSATADRPSKAERPFTADKSVTEDTSVKADKYEVVKHISIVQNLKCKEYNSSLCGITPGMHIC